MTEFERLDPLVQHHIVNTLGWRDLRPLQKASIGPVMSGGHCLLLAPTAGGKTEAAMFPLLSRMCSERWPAPSIVYVCPLKALINNLGERLEKYTSMLGRRVSIWHGDVSQSDRKRTRVEPPDVLITTPESLEAMLISTNLSMRSHLQKLQTVVVDEIHAFAGDDRGWHLLCVLERLAGMAGRDLQRVGLSATVGNPEQLLAWLAGNSPMERVVVQAPVEGPTETDVTLDYVGSLENAAAVISRLDRGEKRLVFCDSRSRVEGLANLLESLSVRAYVSHSSLSAAERRRSEEAFAYGDDCVIVATSTLELGIDVGDLDRVIQVDAPTRVASFLQRLGRTGRRAGKARNCLFLCTSEDALLRAAGLLALWQSGFVEPIVAPPLPYHILAQQMLALCLQNKGMGRQDLLREVRQLPPAHAMDDDVVARILNHLLTSKLLATDGILCFVGEGGEQTFGRRNFLELVSVFTSAPVMSVTDGRQDLGFVDQNLFFAGGPAEGRLLSLAGRGWQVAHVDWKVRCVHVTASEVAGKTVWFGANQGLSFKLCRAIRQVLSEEQISTLWSQRARERIQQAREEYSFARAAETTLVCRQDGACEWYTFGGNSVNLALSDTLNHRDIPTENVDGYGITLRPGLEVAGLRSALEILSVEDVLASLLSNQEAEDALKFSSCVPPNLLKDEVARRQCSAEEVQAVIDERRRWVNL